MRIRLADIIYNSLVNGEGMRRVFFTQGCKHNCKECFNPKTHCFTGGKEYDCDELIKDTIEDIMLKGVTFSGGDPIEQAEKCCYMAKAFKKRGLNIWSFTGYTFEELIESENPFIREYLEQLDVLVDGKFETELKKDGLKYKGSTNQRIINVPKSLAENKVILYKEDL